MLPVQFYARSSPVGGIPPQPPLLKPGDVISKACGASARIGPQFGTWVEDGGRGFASLDILLSYFDIYFNPWLPLAHMLDTWSNRAQPKPPKILLTSALPD